MPISRATGPGKRAATFTGILHAGYKSASNQTVSVERGCTARYSAGDLPLLGHSCRIARGESGSALIVAEEGGLAIIGVLVATTDAGAPPSLAVPAGAFRAAAEAVLARQAGGPPP